MIKAGVDWEDIQLKMCVLDPSDRTDNTVLTCSAVKAPRRGARVTQARHFERRDRRGARCEEGGYALLPARCRPLPRSRCSYLPMCQPPPWALTLALLYRQTHDVGGLPNGRSTDPNIRYLRLRRHLEVGNVR